MKNFDNEIKKDRISILEGILRTSENEDEKLEAINQLKRKIDERSQLALLHVLNDESKRVREAAIQNIISSRVPENILFSHIVKVLNDESSKIREKGIQLLNEIAKEEYLPYFLSKINDESEIVRTIAIQTIAEIGPERALDSLVSQYQSESSSLTRCSILHNIAKINDDSTNDFLTSVLQNGKESVDVRIEAALLLAKSGSYGAFKSITPIVKAQPISNLKIGLIQSLSFIQEEQTVDFLIEVYNDEFQKCAFKISNLNLPDPFLKFMDLDDSSKILISIIKTLGALGHRKAVPFLLKTLNNVYYLIRIQSVGALLQFNDASINERLKSIIRDGTEDLQFKEIMVAVMDKIDKKSLLNINISSYRMKFTLYRRFIEQFFMSNFC